MNFNALDAYFVCIFELFLFDGKKWCPCGVFYKFSGLILLGCGAFCWDVICIFLVFLIQKGEGEFVL